jgi:hypothetical protein
MPSTSIWPRIPPREQARGVRGPNLYGLPSPVNSGNSSSATLAQLRVAELFVWLPPVC